MATSPTFGGAGSIELLGYFLTEGLPPVGEAVERMDVHFLLTALPKADLPTDGDVDEDVEALLTAMTGAGPESLGIGPNHPDWGRSHEEERQRGASVVLRRSARRIALTVVSSLSELDVFGRGPDPETFARAAHELVDGLGPLTKRIRKGDDLDLGALTEHLNARLTLLPTAAIELASTLETLAQRRSERWQSMSPWDRIDVNWSLFAPTARQLLDDPFFWDPADEEAPHGNDTGFDVLSDYLEQRPADPLEFLREQAAEWGYESPTGLEPEDAAEYDLLVIATAFAELKVTGQVTQSLRDDAVRALQRQSRGTPSPTSDLLIAALRR